MTFHEHPERLSHAQLLAYVDDLEDRLRGFMPAGDGAAARLQVAFKLQPGEAGALRALADGRVLDRHYLKSALKTTTGPMPIDKIVDVRICHIRKKLRPHGIEIETVWGVGYRLSKGADVIAAVMKRP